MGCELHPTPGGGGKELELGCNLCIPHVRATYDPLPAIELECVGSRRLQDVVHILVAGLGNHGRYLPDIRGGTIPHVSGWGEVWAIRLQEKAILGHTPQGLQLAGRRVPGPRRVPQNTFGETASSTWSSPGCSGSNSGCESSGGALLLPPLLLGPSSKGCRHPASPSRRGCAKSAPSPPSLSVSRLSEGTAAGANTRGRRCSPVRPPRIRLPEGGR